MPSKVPDSTQWTLRFKNHKTTIFLPVRQTQSFTSIKSDLLNTLQQSGHTEINGRPLPSDPEDIILGVPVDRNDFKEGWVGLEIPEVEEAGDEGVGKKKVRGKKSVLNASPLGAGVKDMGVVAFKFRGENAVRDKEGMDLDDGDWDVVVPNLAEDELGRE